MGKTEDKLEEILELVQNLQSQLSFIQVQIGSGGGPSAGSGGRPQSSGGGGGGTSSIDPKQMQVLEQRLAQLMELEARNAETLHGIQENLNRLVSGKIETADERLNQVTRLLEQGLQLTEMGSHLTEVKDKLEEVLMEINTWAKETVQSPSDS